MRYIKTYEYFKPIKINNEKPFKVDNNIVDKIFYLQDSIKKLKKRLTREKDRKSHAELNNEINSKVKRLSDLTFKQTKQASIQSNKITENVDNNENLINILSSTDFKPEDIKNYIGFDEDDAIIGKTQEQSYPYNDIEYSDAGLTLLINTTILEELFGIEKGSISFALELNNSYNNYEYYVDEDELDYLYGYTTEKTRANIKKLAKIFNFDKNINLNEEGKIRDLFNYLELTDDLESIKNEISMAHDRAIEKAAREVLNKIPFNIDNNSKSETLEKYPSILYFDYETIIKYMKDNSLNVKTIKEFLENIVDSDDLNYSNIEYEESMQYLDMKDVEKNIEEVIDKYVTSPDDIFKIWIEKDNLELFKKNKKYAYYEFNYDYWFKSTRKHNNLFMIAKLYDGKILKWFESYNFQKELINKNFDYYDILNDTEILNSDIEKEYEFMIQSRKFNI